MIINSFKGIHNTNPARSIPDNALVDAVDVDIDNLGVISKKNGYTATSILDSTYYVYLNQGQTSPDSVVITLIITAYTTLDGVSYILTSCVKNGNSGINGLMFMIQPDLSLLPVTDSQGISVVFATTAFSDFGKIVFTNDGYKINGEIASRLKVPTPEYPPYLEASSPYVEGEMAFYKAVYCYRDLVTGLEGGSSPIEIISCAFDSSVSVTPVDPPQGYESVVYVTEINGSTYYSYDGYQLAPVQVLANPFTEEIDKIEYHDERLWLSQLADNGMSIVWYSDKYHYHLYDTISNYLIVPGQIRGMASTLQGLLICTDAAIYVFAESLQLLAGYGVPEGKPISKHQDGTVLIQSNKGICSAFPFQNITGKIVTQDQLSTNYTSIIYKDGINRFISIHNPPPPFVPQRTLFLGSDDFLNGEVTVTGYDCTYLVDGEEVLSDSIYFGGNVLTAFNSAVFSVDGSALTSLIFEPGVFTVTGHNATLTTVSNSAIGDYDTGVFTVTGYSATFNANYGELNAGTGVFSVTVNNASLLHHLTMSASGGSVAITVNNATLTVT